MHLTPQQLLQILPYAGKQAGVFDSALTLAMDKYQINTRLRMAAFIAQVGHESGQFRYVRELGGDQYLSKYDTGPPHNSRVQCAHFHNGVAVCAF